MLVVRGHGSWLYVSDVTPAIDVVIDNNPSGYDGWTYRTMRRCPGKHGYWEYHSTLDFLDVVARAAKWVEEQEHARGLG